MKPPRWACSERARQLLLASLLVAAPLAAPNVACAEGVQRLDRAEFVPSDAAEPPGDSAAWQPVTLPDRRVHALSRSARPVTSACRVG